MSIRKHSVTIQGHRTSFSLEERFWTALKDIAEEQSSAVGVLVEEIDSRRGDTENLSSAIRLFVLEWALAKTAAGAHH